MAKRGSALRGFGYDERNTARLSLVLASLRISALFQRWEKDVQVDALGRIIIRCTAGLDQVVPHGTDGDVISALSTLFVLQGMPKNNVVSASMADLIKYSGVKKGGSTYKRIEESLMRWRHVTYEIVEGYMQSKNRTSMKSEDYNVINSIAIENIETDHSFDEMIAGSKFRYHPTAIFHIELSKQIADSARSGFISELNLDILASLDYHLSRSVYRNLQERRSRTGVKEITVSLIEWGNYLGISNSTPFINDKKMTVNRLTAQPPDKIMRALKTVHTDLKRVGYISSVIEVGKGVNKKLIYKFDENGFISDSDVVGWLTLRGVGESQAKKYARNHLRERIDRAIQIFDKKLSGGYKTRNPPGFLIKIIDELDDYDVELVSPTERKQRRKNNNTQPLLELSSTEQRKSRIFIINQWKRKGIISSEDADALASLSESGKLDDTEFSLTLVDPNEISSLVSEILRKSPL